MFTTSLRRGAIAIAASSALAVVTLAAPAQATTNDQGSAASIIVAGPSGGLAAAFAGSPTSLLQGLLCPIVTALSNTTTNIPVVGPVVDQLPNVVCALSVLGYVYKTTYLPPTGPPIVRYTRALAGVPTLLDVDGNGFTDFLGTLTLSLSLNGITLNVSRTGFPVTGRVSIEAIAIDPATANTYVGFGEDGTAVGTAQNWSTTVSVLGFSGSTADIGLSLKTSQPQSSLAAIGELFSGANADAPDHVYRGNASFAPVPAAFTTEIRASQGRQEAIVTSPPTTLTAKVDVLSPGRAQNIGLTANQLPSSIDVVHTTSGTSDTTTYDASGSIAQLNGTYRDTVSGNIATDAALDAWGVPAHIRFDQTGATTSVGATSGQFDRVQARFAQGTAADPLDPATTPFARYHRTSSTAFTAGVQLSNLKSVSINQSAPYGGELVFGTAPALFPFTAQDDTSGLHLDGSLSNLPADTTVGVDLTNGLVTFNGHGTGIDEIKIHATRPAPFFARATRLDATLDNLPASETVNVAQSNGGVTASASAPLGALSLLASDGSDAPAISGSAASYEDTSSLYRAFVRISGLEGLSFQANPVIASMQTATPQVLTVHGNLSGLTFDGTIDKLPANLTFSMQPGAGGSNVVDYNSHGSVIDKITASGSGLPAPTGMPNFEAEIDQLPSHLTVTLPATTGNVVFDAHGDHIGRVYAQAWGGTKASLAANQQTVEYVDGQHIAANLLQVGSAQVSTTASPFHLQYDISSSPLDFEYVAADAKFLRGTISNPTPATVDFNTSNKTSVHYRATTNTQINSITLKTDLAGGYIDADLQNIAPDVQVCFSSTNKACKPGFVPANTLTTTGGDTYTMPAALFDFSLTPTDLSGAQWPNRFRLDGTYCFNESDPTTCLNGSNHKQRITMDDLEFGKVAVGAGFQSDGCTACTAGRAYAYFDTNNTLISGDVKYFNEGDSDAFVHYHTDSNSSGIEAQNKLLFVQYCIVCLNETNLTTVSGGSFSCVADPHLDISIPVFDDIDVLSGSFIHFC
ncbi:MAG: hypothetical protein JWR52_583 [Marmoricola sp.]|nr:hypothetical protein [Marmoricola sp.]